MRQPTACKMRPSDMRAAWPIWLLLLAGTLAAAQQQAVPPAAAAPPSGRAAADANTQKARTVLDRALQALGGKAFLEFTDREQHGRTSRFYRGQAVGVGGDFRRIWKWPAKDRYEFFKGGEWTVLFNGDEGFDITYRGTRHVDPPDIEEYIRRRDRSLDYVFRLWATDPGTLLFHDGVVIVDGNQADKLTLVNKKNQDVSLFFDSRSGLPVRLSYTYRDPQTREKIEEGEIFANYKSVQGIMTPMRVQRTRNGEMIRQYFYDRVAYNTGASDSLFAATATYEAPKTFPPK